VQKVYVETLGCKVNRYETSCVLGQFLEAGYKEAKYMKSADIIIINTCTVTNRTDYKSRNLITNAGLVKKGKPETKIVVTGCYSQRSRDEVKALGFVDLIVDNNSKNNIYEYIIENLTIDNINFTENEHLTEFSEMEMSSAHDRNRAFLKIQDGCDYYCSYCIVPFVRGKPRSRSLDSINKQVEKFLSNGYEEIVLSGVNLGLYRDNGLDLADLLFELEKYDKLKRIRIGSIEPELFTDKLLYAINKIDKICPHFHIPLQTGSDSLLKLHGRKYSVEYFRNLVCKLQQLRPDCALGFDVIVGLPEETDELFEETYNFLKNIDVAYLHVFMYSKRKGTVANKMANQVHGTIAKKRSRKLINMELRKKREYMKRLLENDVTLYAVGETLDVENNVLMGTSDRYVRVGYDAGTINYEPKTLVKLKPINLYEHGIFCEVVK